MLMTKERRPAFRTTEGWARSVLLEAGAVRQCEEHGWMRDRADPHARERQLCVPKTQIRAKLWCNPPKIACELRTPIR